MSVPVELRVPGSKSATLRALVAAALAPGRSRLSGALACDDSRALAAALAALGAEVREGRVWEVEGRGALAPGPRTLPAGESGAALRFLLALAATGAGSYRIDTRGRLGLRPVGELLAALAALGGGPVAADRDGYAVAAHGLVGGSLALGPQRSSQTVSALLLAAPRMRRGLDLTLSRPSPGAGYVGLTLGTMAAFGVPVTATASGGGLPASGGRLQVAAGSAYRAADVTIEGDWSSAGYLLAASAILGREVALHGLDPDSPQPDRRLLELLRSSGVEAGFRGAVLHARGQAVRPFVANLDDCPDLAPTLAVLAACVPGRTSELRGLGRLRDKESDRLLAMAGELAGCGIAVAAGDDWLRVHGGQPRPAALSGHGDHRVVMSLALLSLREPGVTVGDRAAVAKSYPGFFADLARFAGVPATGGGGPQL